MQTPEVLNELRNGLRVFRAFQAAEEVIVVLEGAEQNVRELREAADRLRSEQEASRAAFNTELQQLDSRVTAARASAAAAEEAAKVAGEATLAAAQAAADKKHQEADDLVANAIVERNGVLHERDEARAGLEAAQAELKVVQEKLAAAKAEINKLLSS